MKQHITIKQLNELSEIGKEKLWQYAYNKVTKWIPFKIATWGGRDQLPENEELVFIEIDDHETGDYIRYISEISGARYTEKEGFQYENKCWLPLLSIGQMIEFIDENDVGEWSIHNEAGDGWTINSNNLYAPQYYIPQTGKDSGDICDCLWEAVKYILEKEE